MHETSEYYRYINLCKLESDTLVYFNFFYCKHKIFKVIHNLHKIYLHILDNNHLNANKKLIKILIYLE